MWRVRRRRLSRRQSSGIRDLKRNRVCLRPLRIFSAFSAVQDFVANLEKLLIAESAEEARRVRRENHLQ